MNATTYTPSIDPAYIPFGVYPIVAETLTDDAFVALYISGEAGNGKTQAVVQAHAVAQRPLIRVNLSEQSDETLLLHTALVDGDTVDRLGPVALAAQQGWSVLLDEFDCGGPLLMTLQAVLEGKPFTLPRTGERIVPAPGFKVFATGNTLGRGSERYINTRPLNEATLDRFSFYLTQPYPDALTEARILKNRLPAEYPLSAELPAALAQWAAAIREAHAKGRIADTMTTRRMLHLVTGLRWFGWRVPDAIAATVARFGPATAEAMLRFWTDAVADPALNMPGHATATPTRRSATTTTAPAATPVTAAEFV